MSSPQEELFQDLLKNPAFKSWILEGSPESENCWRDWATADTAHREALAMARFTLLSLHQETHTVTDEHISHKVRQALEIARRRESVSGRNHFIKTPFTLKSGWLTAASVMLLVAIGLGFYGKFSGGSLFSENQKQLTGTHAIVEVVNTNQKAQYVQLPDGSSVILRQNSRISYPKQFGSGKRVVILSGEAFFEVTKDPARPFFVYANELVTRVLGTSFSIKANENSDDVLVAVKTGKVSVFSNKNPGTMDSQQGKKLPALVLTPNQQASYKRGQVLLTRTTDAGSALLKIPIEDQGFVYHETPVEEVFSSLEKAYGIDIEFNAQTMANCSITATLGDEPLDNKLKWICTILEANYQINDKKITITGNGCQ